MKRERITGLILAGGRGSRLGGLDKGLVKWHGRPLVAHAIEHLAPQVGRVLISANRNRERYEAFGHPVIADTLADYAGPLAGLQAGLAACTTPLLVTVPCDAPALPPDLVDRLLAALEAGNARVAVVETQGKFQPTFLLCRQELSAALDAWLAGGNRKVADWLRQMGAIAVPFADEAAFANFNTPEDLA
jgi:molybdopterin-guanine dinucleotide biosynthesis protein A